MQHLTAGIFGDKELLKKLGKQGTVNDIAIYNHASSDGVYTYAAPNSDEKIQPLLQVLGIIDVPVIAASEVTRELAEQIIAIDAAGFEKGFIISADDQLKNIIKGTVAEKYEWISDEKELRERLKDIKNPPATSEPWAPVDNYFNVKSVGTVVLTIIKGGTIKKHDRLLVQPLGKEVLIKGIQSQDKDIDQAEAGMRAGLNLKGIDADDLKRGYVICNSAEVSKNVKIEFKKSKYSRESTDTGNQIFLSAGTQCVPGRIENSESNLLTVLLEHPIAYIKNQKCLVATTKQTMPRIMGSGTIN